MRKITITNRLKYFHYLEIIFTTEYTTFKLLNKPDLSKISTICMKNEEI